MDYGWSSNLVQVLEKFKFNLRDTFLVKLEKINHKVSNYKYLLNLWINYDFDFICITNRIRDILGPTDLYKNLYCYTQTEV